MNQNRIIIFWNYRPVISWQKKFWTPFLLWYRYLSTVRGENFENCRKKWFFSIFYLESTLNLGQWSRNCGTFWQYLPLFRRKKTKILLLHRLCLLGYQIIKITEYQINSFSVSFCKKAEVFVLNAIQSFLSGCSYFSFKYLRSTDFFQVFAKDHWKKLFSTFKVF